MSKTVKAPREAIYILLIDDEPMQLSLIKPILTNFDPDLIIETLADPSKAVEKVIKNEYDCVIADYSMPSVSGLDLVKAIKNVRNIPCILYTGRGSDEVKRDALVRDRRLHPEDPQPQRLPHPGGSHQGGRREIQEITGSRLAGSGLPCSTPIPLLLAPRPRASPGTRRPRTGCSACSSSHCICGGPRDRRSTGEPSTRTS